MHIPELLHGAARAKAEAPAFDPSAAPAAPLELLKRWLHEAVEAGVVEPQAMMLATATPTDGPDSRTLLLKDVSDDALVFSTSERSPKGRQLQVDPRAAVTLYWREQGRQIRVRGIVTKAPRAEAQADFAKRHPDSRAVVVALPQSDPIDDAAAAAERLAAAKQRVADDPDLVPDDWTVYRLEPMSVEFWQATTGRDQVRLRYDRASTSHDWARSELWP